MKNEKLSLTLFIVNVLIGVGLLFIGTRFLFAPEAGEAGFGINFQESGDYAFHYIKGIRDIFSGSLILAFTLLNRRIELALVIGLGAMIPLVDFLVVLTAPNSNPAGLWIHGGTAVFLIILSWFVARRAAAPVSSNSSGIVSAKV